MAWKINAPDFRILSVDVERLNVVKLRNIIFMAFLVRVMLIPFFRDDFNLWSWRIFDGFLIEGFNPWIIVFHDPTLYWINPWRYAPLSLLPIVPAQLVYEYVRDEVIFLYLTKMPLIAADLITTLFLHKILRILSADMKTVSKLTMLYAFNPITIFVSAIWGATDSIPLMFTVISLFFFLRAKALTKLASSAIFLGWGIAFKLYPIFILPVFVAKLKDFRQTVTFIVLSLVPLAISSVPFLIWNFESYVNRLLLHNIGGTYPLFSPLHPQIPLSAKIILSLVIVTLFIIAYLKRASIITKIVLSFFALYLALGGLTAANYFIWVIPFAILLLADRSVKMFQGSGLLPFLAIPSIIYWLIFNGPYDSVEGVTGILYWTYHWLQCKIVIFKALPFLQIVKPIIALTNITIMVYFFYEIGKGSHAPSVRRGDTANHSGSTTFSTLRKNKNLVLLSLAILIVSLSVFPRIVQSEPLGTVPEVASLTFTFFDNFSRSILNRQWSFAGNGTYMLHPEANPSHILLNAYGTSSINGYLYRGWEDIQHGFFNSSSANIKFRFKGLIAAKTDGGWLEVENFEFTYSDSDTNDTMPIAQIDNEWHVFEIDYNMSGRFISFDNNFQYKYAKHTFSFLFLGGPCSIDWVKVVIEDFPTGNPSRTYALLALGVPSTTLVLITAGLLYPKTFHLHVFGPRAREVKNETECKSL